MAKVQQTPLECSAHRRVVLFAISDQPVRQLIAALLPAEAFPYHYELVTSLPQAQTWLAHHTPVCVVMTVDIAVGSSTTPGLIELLPSNCPSVSLVQRGRDNPAYPAYLYTPGTFHTWCMMPFNIDELIARIQGSITCSEQENKQTS
jgi:hypothetical protein